MRHGAFTARDAAVYLFEPEGFLTSASSPYLCQCYRLSLPPPSENQGPPPPSIAPYAVNGCYVQGGCSGDALRLPIRVIREVSANAESISQLSGATPSMPKVVPSLSSPPTTNILRWRTGCYWATTSQSYFCRRQCKSII